MSDLNCYYHPNLTAKEKCNVCGKLLCQQCSTQHKHVDSMPPPPPPPLPRWKIEDGRLRIVKNGPRFLEPIPRRQNPEVLRHLELREKN